MPFPPRSPPWRVWAQRGAPRPAPPLGRQAAKRALRIAHACPTRVKNDLSKIRRSLREIGLATPGGG